jgi:hypothetical protein
MESHFCHDSNLSVLGKWARGKQKRAQHGAALFFALANLLKFYLNWK